MDKAKTYLKNAAILTITGLALRAAGMGFRVYMAAQIGAEGMGLYQLIFSIYNLCITFATSGVSVAATRLAAEELTRNDIRRTASVMTKVIALGLALGVVAAAGQYLFAYPISKYGLGDVRAELSLKILAPSLPFMAVAAALKGYFFAQRRVGPSTKSQIVEQIIRIVMVVALLPLVQDWGVQYSCAAVVLGNAVSEILSCIMVMVYYKKDMRRFGTAERLPAPKGTERRILKTAAPVEGGRFVDSALHAVENMLVPACLLAFSGSRELSLAQFGALKGMAMPILLFPFSFLNPLATLFLPEITEAHILNRKKTLEALVGRIMLLTNVFSVLAGGLICMNAYPLARLIYHDESVGFYLMVLAPILPAMYLDSMGDAILKGLGEEFATFRYSIWDSTLRIGLVLMLMPKMGMTGFMVVMVASNVLSAIMNIYRIAKVTNIKIRTFRWFVQPILLFLVAGALGLLCLRLTPFTSDWSCLLFNCAVTGVVYLVLMLQFGLWDAVKGILEKKKKAETQKQEAKVLFS